MLSWVSGINRAHNHRPPAWYENEMRLNIRTDATPTHATTPTRRVGLFPKIRRAFEAATHTSNGSFPVQEPMVPPSPGEETAFEACDSGSQCGQSMGDSCATSASYDMSRIDTQVDVDMSSSVAPSPTASEADSLFGVNIRDMVRLGDKKKEKDDVWLLDEIECPPPPPLKSPAMSVLRRVPVLRLPMLPDRKRNTQIIPDIEDELDELDDDDDDLEEEDEEEGEEEIEFGDSTVLIKQTEEHFNMEVSKEEEGCSDENKNSNIMSRFGRSRNRAQMLRQNFKGIWSSTDCAKRAKNAKSRYKQTKKRTTPTKLSIAGTFAVDPLKELSKCHEKMLEIQQPFSPKRALSRIRSRIRREASDNIHGQHSILLSASSSASSGVVTADEDETSEVTLPSELFPSMSTTTSNTFDIYPSDRDETLASSRSDSESQSSGSDGQSSSGDTPAANGPSSKKKGRKPPAAFKIKFRSPRNDTPRVVVADELSDSDSGEEPRALYTDEGHVEAWIHPKGITNSASMDSRSSLNHEFHSELSTLYEVSSSLESASFSTKSSAASTEATSLCATAGNSHKLEYASSTPSSLVAIDSLTTLTTFDTSSKQRTDECLAPSTPSKLSRLSFPSQYKTNAIHHRGGFVEDQERKMWEISVGRMEDTRHWRQPNMPLMNTNELSRSYVAEI